MPAIHIVCLDFFNTLLTIAILVIATPVVIIIIYLIHITIKTKKEVESQKNVSVAEILASRSTPPKPATLQKPVIPDELREARIKLNVEYDKKVSEGTKAFFDKAQPVTQVNVSKIGHCDAYHLYEIPDTWEQIDDFTDVVRSNNSYRVEVDHEPQYHEDDDDKEREAYVVNIDGADIGELSKATIERIEREIDFYDAAFNVVSIRIDGDKIQIRLNVFDTRLNGIPDHT